MILCWRHSFREAAVVVVGHQVGLRAAHIPQEPVGDVGAAHEPAGHRRQVVPNVVPATPLELPREGGCPGLHAHFIAVDQRSRQTLGRKRSHHLEQLSEELLEVKVHGCPAVFVALQTSSAVRGRMVLNADGGVPDAENGPVAGGSLPVQAALRVHVLRDVDDRGRVDNRVAGHHLTRSLGPGCRIDVAGLDRPLVDAGRARETDFCNAGLLVEDQAEEWRANEGESRRRGNLDGIRPGGWYGDVADLPEVRTIIRGFKRHDGRRAAGSAAGERHVGHDRPCPVWPGELELKKRRLAGTGRADFDASIQVAIRQRLLVHQTVARGDVAERVHHGSALSRQGRERQYECVTIVAALGVRLRQSDVHSLAAVGVDLGPSQLLHR